MTTAIFLVCAIVGLMVLVLTVASDDDERRQESIRHNGRAFWH